MKKFLALSLAIIMLFILAACGGNTESKHESGNIPDSLTLLNTIWATYAQDERFPAGGGDFSDQNITMDAPGKFGIEDTNALNSTLGLPEASVSMIDDAASLMHMMNANTFTCGAFRLNNADDSTAFTSALKDNILNRQWMCGFPDKLLIMTVDNYVISVFGNEDLLAAFKDKTAAAYSNAAVVCEEPII